VQGDLQIGERASPIKWFHFGAFVISRKMMYFPTSDRRRLKVTMLRFRHAYSICICLWMTTSLMACETSIRNDAMNTDESRFPRSERRASSVGLQTLYVQAPSKDISRPAQTNSVNQSSDLDDAVKARLIVLGAIDDSRGLKFLKEPPTLLSDQHRVDADAHMFLHNLSEILLLDSRRTVLIEGFSDDANDEQENQALSERKSGALRSALVSMGIDGRRISSRGYGSASHLNGAVSLISAGQHSRLEIFVSDISGIIPSRYLLKPD
jgi:outer membrane protein OmpA-like peptidoglycan-associated protein